MTTNKSIENLENSVGKLVGMLCKTSDPKEMTALNDQIDALNKRIKTLRGQNG